MELRRVIRLGLAGSLIAVGLMIGAAYAQPTGEVAAPTDTAAGMRRDVKLSLDEQVKNGEDFIGRMDAASKNVRLMLEKAREQRDVVKSLCLSDKLTQLDVAKKSAAERHDALKQAAARQDSELGNHEYTILVVLKERGDQLAMEANQCIGVEAGFVGETKVTVTVDPNLPQQDPAQYPENTPIITSPPACVSCIQ